MFDLKSNERRCLLPSLAILATVIGPLTDSCSYASLRASRPVELQSKPGFSLQNSH